MVESPQDFLKNLRGSQCLVTGATGFIGLHLCRRLIAEGALVTALVRPSSEIGSLAHLGERLTILRTDICDRDGLRSAIEDVRPERVFHLAAYTSVGREYKHADEAFRTNLGGTVNLLRSFDRLPVEAIVVSGTCEEYGDAEPPFGEDTPIAPVSPYSVSKSAATLWSRMIHQQTGMPVVILRPFLTYGPGQAQNRMLPQAILAALRDQDFPMTPGEQTREFTHVDDIVDCYLRASIVPAAAGEIINVGSGIELKIRDVVTEIYELTGSRGRPLPGAMEYRPSEVWRSVSDPRKAERLLGWRAKIPFRDGLRQTIEWYRATLDSPPAQSEVRQ